MALAGPQGKSDICMAGVSALVSASESNVQIVGREVWTSDHGSTHQYTEDATGIYDFEPIPVGSEQVLIGDKK